METLLKTELEKLSFKRNLQEALSHLSDVTLTDDEHDEAILTAKQRKKALIEEQARNAAIEKNRKVLSTMLHTYEQQYGAMLYRAGQLYENGVFSKKFVIDEHNRHVIFLLCCYFSKDKQFTDAGYDLNKGICLYGNPGRGKSWLMRLFQKNTRQCFHIKGCKEIAGQYQQHGVSVIEDYSTPIKALSNDANVYYQPEIGVCFSDLGTEAIKKNFGNEANVMEDILFERDRLNLRKDLTHIETNLSGPEIEAFYGVRIRSRIREMFNWIEVPGDDRRK